uniref:Poly(A) polymerase n=1 Tax=Anopheles minimus TaxID=112268 RepID=A0A182W0N7_9DIPT
MWNSERSQPNGGGSGSATKTLGMTSAISTAEPKPEDIQKTKELEKSLEPYNVFEAEEELNHRMEILAKLNTLVKQWVRDVSIAKNMPEAMAEKLGGKIYTFGSYRLGVHHKGADIDALCVAPRNIERSDYFGSFFELLKQQPEVTECRAVEEAFVPVIKMNFDGIEIDLLFARLALKEIPDNFDLRDDMLLKNLDQKSVRSLNGCRVTDEILRLWPQPVLLKQPDNVNLGFMVWDPRVNVQDRFHLMPIITPAYPQQNSTFNVSSSTRKVMLMEFKRGMQITDDIMMGKQMWEKYRHFIVLLVTSSNADDHLEWCGLVESKIRYLILNLERNQHINLAHVNPKCYEQHEQNAATTLSGADGKPNPFCSLWFIGLEFERSENLNVDLTESIQNFTDSVHKHAVHIKLLKDGMKIEARHVRRKQLTQYLDPNLLKRERKISDSYTQSCSSAGGSNSNGSASPADAASRKRKSTDLGSSATASVSSPIAVGSNGSASKKRRNDSFDGTSNGSFCSTSSTTVGQSADAPNAEANDANTSTTSDSNAATSQSVTPSASTDEGIAPSASSEEPPSGGGDMLDEESSFEPSTTAASTNGAPSSSNNGNDSNSSGNNANAAPAATSSAEVACS